MKKLALFAALILLCSCQSSREGSVIDNVLGDFGLKERPEGYVSGSDRVLENMPDVAKGEIRRLNIENRNGKVIRESEGELEGRYYKQVKVYENYYIIDAKPSPRSNDDDRGYVGYIEYSYRMHESPRKPNRTIVEAEQAAIETDKTGRETYLYNFSSSGTWRGGKGKIVK